MIGIGRPRLLLSIVTPRGLSPSTPAAAAATIRAITVMCVLFVPVSKLAAERFWLGESGVNMGGGAKIHPSLALVKEGVHR